MTLSDKTLKRKRNILQIVPSLNCGGVERGTIDIARAIVASGDNALVLASGGSLCSKVKEIPAKLIKHDVITKNPLKIYNNISFIENLIKEENIDIIHARSRAPAWSAYYASLRQDKPFITTFHGIYNIKSPFKQYYNSIMTKGQRIIAVSDFVRQHILENYTIDEDLIRVIHRGVDLDYFSPFDFDAKQIEKLKDKYNIKTSSPFIVMPSRMTPWKGQHILIEALSKIKHLDFYCMLVGDLSKHPEYIKRLKDLIVHHKLQSKVQIYGPDVDIVALYNIASIIVSASIEPEAFGRTIVEAQAMKKLVIAPNIGGAAETIEDHVTGFHVKPCDIGQMADTIKYVLGIIASSEADKITTAARKSVSEKFSLAKMQSSTLSVYSEVK
jgi:glycosyltransferase involved in cell wall biosynthesis